MLPVQCVLECSAGWRPALCDAPGVNGRQIQDPYEICQTLNPGSTVFSVVLLPCDDPIGRNALSWGTRPESSGGGQKASRETASAHRWHLGLDAAPFQQKEDSQMVHPWWLPWASPWPPAGSVATWTSTVGGAEQVVSPAYVKGVALVPSWAGDSIL